eukprot:629659-Rhodomonas_salina.5
MIPAPCVGPDGLLLDLAEQRGDLAVFLDQPVDGFGSVLLEALEQLLEVHAFVVVAEQLSLCREQSRELDLLDCVGDAGGSARLQVRTSTSIGRTRGWADLVAFCSIERVSVTNEEIFLFVLSMKSLMPSEIQFSAVNPRAMSAFRLSAGVEHSCRRLGARPSSACW